LFDQVFLLIIPSAEHTFFSEAAKGFYPCDKLKVFEVKEGFSKKKAEIPEGGLNDYSEGMAGRTVWNSKGKGGLSILEFPKSRRGLDKDATRGRVWIFTGINHCM